MTNVEQNVGSATSIRGLEVEVGLVRDKKVSSADTTVLDYQGKSAGLTTAETAKGLTKGSYSHQGEASSTSATDAGSAALSKARSALSKVQQTTDALRAFAMATTPNLTPCERKSRAAAVLQARRS